MKANKLRKIICSEGNPCDNRCASFEWCNKVEQEILKTIEECKRKLNMKDVDDINENDLWNRAIDYVIKQLNLIQETMK